VGRPGGWTDPSNVKDRQEQKKTVKPNQPVESTRDSGDPAKPGRDLFFSNAFFS
jgi:hypothetical protein